MAKAPLLLGKPRLGARLADRDVVWRYLDTAKFMDFLENKSLYFCRGDQFEDKFEGSFTKSLQHAIEKSYQMNSIASTYEKFRDQLRKRVFVNCWHRSPDDSMAMWNLYGRSSCSIAITSTIGALRRSIESQSLPYYFLAERVTYVKHWRDPIININPYSRVFSYKVKAYEYEKEMRILLDRSINDFDAEIVETGMSIEVEIDVLLRSIVLSPEAPAWFEALIRSLRERYDLKAPVHRSKLATEPI
jgi:hypothetical protein